MEWVDEVVGKPRTWRRLIERVTVVVADVGYPDTSVDLVLAGTAVARSTFYEHFRDLGVCFEQALRTAGENLIVHLDGEPSSTRPTCEAIVARLVGFCREQRSSACLLFCESLAAGPRARRVRDGLAGEVEVRLQGSWEAEGHPGEAPGGADLALIVFRLLALQLGRGEADGEDLEAALLSWIGIYRRRPSKGPGDDSIGLTIDPLPSAELPWLGGDGAGGGRGRRAGEALARSRRARILGAVLTIAAEGGYGATTVAAISARAGVSRTSFYELFAGREEAAVIAAESVFQACMTSAAGAFFSRQTWPERIWEGGRALLSFIAAFPADAYYGFVETPAISRAAATMVDERLGAFTLFLEDGYRHAPDDEVPRATSQVLMAAMFEFAYQDLCEHRSGAELLGRLPEFVYLILAPFLGEQEAGEFVAGKLAGG